MSFGQNPGINIPQVAVPVISPQNQVNTDAGNVVSILSAAMRENGADNRQLASTFAAIPGIMQRKREIDLQEKQIDAAQARADKQEALNADIGEFNRLTGLGVSTNDTKYFDLADEVANRNPAIFSNESVLKNSTLKQGYLQQAELSPITGSAAYNQLISTGDPDLIYGVLSGKITNDVTEKSVGPDGKEITNTIFKYDPSYRDLVLSTAEISQYGRGILYNGITKDIKDALALQKTTADISQTYAQAPTQLAIAMGNNATSTNNNIRTTDAANARFNVSTEIDVARLNEQQRHNLTTEQISASKITGTPNSFKSSTDRQKYVDANPYLVHNIVNQSNPNVPPTGTPQEWNETARKAGAYVPNADIKETADAVVRQCSGSGKSVMQCYADVVKPFLGQNEDLQQFITKQVDPKGSTQRKNAQAFGKFISTPVGQGVIGNLVQANKQIVSDPNVFSNLTGMQSQAVPSLENPTGQAPTTTKQAPRSMTEATKTKDLSGMRQIEKGSFSTGKSPFSQ